MRGIEEFLSEQGLKTTHWKGARLRVSVELPRLGHSMTSQVIIDQNKLSDLCDLVMPDYFKHANPLEIQIQIEQWKERDKMKRSKFSEKMFYMMSRGISFKSSLKSLTGEIKTQYLFFFDPLPQYVACFERNWINQCKRKIDYCIANRFEDMLNYESKKDGEFTLQEYLDYITQEEEETA